MTSEIIQNKHADNKISTMPKPFQDKLELTRNQSFLDGTQDIFDILARHNQGYERWEENIGTTLNVLEHARDMLRTAEQKISEQDKRLKTIENAAGVDALTGLLNKKGFSRALSREIARTNRGYNEGGLLVMFNLENLFSIESERGPEAAETAIRLVAQALESEIRDMDLVARVDEDEFVLLFTDTSMGKALSRLQNMALRLNRLSLIQDGEEIRINLSLGLKSYEQGAKPDKIFKAANSDLQRNRKGAQSQMQSQI